MSALYVTSKIFHFVCADAYRSHSIHWPKSPMESPDTIYLRSDFDVEECMRRLREAIDPPKWEFFFPFGYGGSKPYLGKFRRNQAKIWKRRETRNDFAPCFHGEISPEGSGARLEQSKKIAGSSFPTAKTVHCSGGPAPHSQQSRTVAQFWCIPSSLE